MFTQFCIKCISMCGSRMRKPKIGASASTVQSNLSKEPGEEKACNQVRKRQKKKIQVQAEFILQQAK